VTPLKVFCAWRFSLGVRLPDFSRSFSTFSPPLSLWLLALARFVFVFAHFFFFCTRFVCHPSLVLFGPENTSTYPFFPYCHSYFTLPFTGVMVSGAVVFFPPHTPKFLPLCQPRFRVLMACLLWVRPISQDSVRGSLMRALLSAQR